MNTSFLKRVIKFWSMPEAPKRAEFLLRFVKALQKSDVATKEVMKVSGEKRKAGKSFKGFSSPVRKKALLKQAEHRP